MDLAVALTVLVIILPAELPDKTLVATLVLSTRYRPWPVFLGVSAAFAVQCVVAVTAGQLLGLLPRRLVFAVVAVLFAVGAYVLLRGEDEEPEVVDEEASADAEVPSFRRVALTSFGVLFAAEWGDASQLVTAGLTARYHDPVSVFVGSFVALAGVAGLAVLLGQVIVRVVPLHAIRRLAGVLFAVLALVALLVVFGVGLPVG
ncbi:MAG: TMEM165/GDT1 family protein [Actinomycetota bacterium]|nr:TMEM165/GDT1 family protein [Actinomycetota bacterium]